MSAPAIGPIGPLAAALDGIRVLDLSRLLPGPFLTMVLADMGADVIKVEDPHVGDYLRPLPPTKGGMSARYLAINRGKRSLVLDLKSPTGRDALFRMVERADVIVESFRPGVMSKLGLGYDALAARNPKIVMCAISGFGQTGPYVQRAGHDVGYLAVAGAIAMGGVPGGEPWLPGVQIADLAGGALWSATAILAALVGRQRTGKGAYLDISMTEGSLALLTAEIGNLETGAHPTRGSETLNGGVAAYGIYRTADDRYLAVGALEPTFWAALNQGIGRPVDLGEVVAPPATQAKLREQLAAIFATKTAAQWHQILFQHDCCVEVVTELDELADHPLHRAREVFFTIDGGDGVGPIQQTRTPVGRPKRATPPPRLGQHSREVLAEYGFSGDEIAALCAMVRA